MSGASTPVSRNASFSDRVLRKTEGYWGHLLKEKEHHSPEWSGWVVLNPLGHVSGLRTRLVHAQSPQGFLGRPHSSAPRGSRQIYRSLELLWWTAGLLLDIVLPTLCLYIPSGVHERGRKC